jgi:hypothetical protein
MALPNAEVYCMGLPISEPLHEVACPWVVKVMRLLAPINALALTN